MIREAFVKLYYRYGWLGIYEELKKNGYSRSFSGMVHAAKRLGLKESKTKPSRKMMCLLSSKQ